MLYEYFKLIITKMSYFLYKKKVTLNKGRRIRNSVHGILPGGLKLKAVKSN